MEGRLRPDAGAASTPSLTRTPQPRATVECGSYSNPNYGCTDEREDAIAAYTDALAWYVTRDEPVRQEGHRSSWTPGRRVIKDHTNSNAPLQTGWAGSSWPRAAEIIKYTYTASWPNSGRFATMLRNVYLPEVINGSNSNGNWELSMMEAAIGISVFLEDKDRLRQGDGEVPRPRAAPTSTWPPTATLPKTVPARTSTPAAKIVSYWQGQSTFVDRPDPGDLPRPHPHRVRHLRDLARRRDQPDPGPGPVRHGRRRAAAAGARLPGEVRAGRRPCRAGCAAAPEPGASGRSPRSASTRCTTGWASP